MNVKIETRRDSFKIIGAIIIIVLAGYFYVTSSIASKALDEGKTIFFGLKSKNHEFGVSVESKAD